jgi:hypothetical protein
LAKRSTVTVTWPWRSAERGDGALGLHDVALDRRARRVRAAHRLGEVGRVVALAAVVVAEDLKTSLRTGEVRPAARGQDVQRADHVALVRDARRRGRGVDDHPGVDHRVDARRPARSA